MPTKRHGYGDDYMAIQCAGYVKNPENGMWYYHQEVLPPPTSASTCVDHLMIRVTLDAEPDEFQDMVEENYVSLFLTFESANKIYELSMQSIDEWCGWLKFTQDIKDGKDTRLGPIEYSEHTFHAWHVGGDRVRFVIQLGEGVGYYGNVWTDENFAPESADILPWQFAIDIEIDRQKLLAALNSTTEHIRHAIESVFAPAICPVFEKPLPQPTMTVNDNGRRYDYFLAYRWTSAATGCGHEYRIMPHMQRHRCPPLDVDFKVQIHAEGEYFVTITHRKVHIGLLMPEWTHWEECICEWLNLLVDNRGWGAVCFNTEGIEAVLCADSDDFHILKNPHASKDYLNFLVWADGSWYPNSGYNRDHKDRAIHIKIERRKLVQQFYDVIQYVLQKEGGALPNTPWARQPYDLSAVEKYLKEVFPA